METPVRLKRCGTERFAPGRRTYGIRGKRFNEIFATPSNSVLFSHRALQLIPFSVVTSFALMTRDGLQPEEFPLSLSLSNGRRTEICQS